MNFIRRRDKEFRSHSQSHYSMSTKTRDFLQKICYKKTASVDMTQYGFINESKVKPVNLLLRPLRQQLEKICGPSHDSSVTKKSTSKKIDKKQGEKGNESALKTKEAKAKKKKDAKQKVSKHPIKKKLVRKERTAIPITGKK